MTARGPRRVLSATLTALALAGATLVATLVPAAVGPVASASAVDAPLTSATDDPVSIRITSISPQVLEPGQDLVVTAVLTNRSGRAIEDAEAVLRLNRFRMTSRAEVAAWSALGTADEAGARAAVEPVGKRLAAGASRTVTLTVPAAEVGLLDLPGLWGPRGMAVEVATVEGRLGLARSYALWNPDDTLPRVPVAVVLPLVGPATTGTTPQDDEPQEPDAEPTPDPTPTPTGEDALASAGAVAQAQRTADDQLTGLVSPSGRLEASLRAASADPSISLAIDPALLRLAESGDETSKAWAARVRQAAAQRGTFVLPWSDPDAAALAHASDSELLGLAAARSTDDTSLDADGLLLWAAADEQPDGPTLAGAGTADADGMVTPPSEPGTAAADGIDATRDADETDGVVAEPATDEAASSESLRSVRTATGEVAALVPDGVLTDLVTDRPRTTTPAVAAQRALADLALVAREPALPSVVLIAPSRTDVPDRATLAAILSAVRQAPWAQVTTLARALDAGSALPPSDPARTAVSPDELPPGKVTELADAREAARSFAEVVDGGAERMQEVDDAVLAPLAVAWRDRPAQRSGLVRRVVTEVAAGTQGLSIVPTSDLNVIATEGDVRLTVRNDLDVAARAQLVVDPRKACLTTQRVDDVELPPGSETAVTVPLQAHANCDVVVKVRLVGPAGQDVAEPIEFTARVSPTIESVGTIVVAVLLALGLVLGIVRTVRRGQSARRGARTVAEADAPLTLPVLGGSPETKDDDEART